MQPASEFVATGENEFTGQFKQLAVGP